jgi:hypothetical protein
MDPIGFGFENYDAIGQYRTHENGLEVDASGEIAAVKGGPIAYRGAIELGRALSALPEVQRCITRQFARLAWSRVEAREDASALEDLDQAFQQSGSNLRDLIVQIVSHDTFERRLPAVGEITE